MSQIINSYSGKYEFLSNFFFVDNYCVEIEFQADKAVREEDRQRIMNLYNRHDLTNYKKATEAKRIGRFIKCRPDWPAVRVPIMKEKLLIKFSYLTMREMLRETKDAQLIEGNWWHDTFWGVCTGEGRVKKCGGPHEPCGENHLGILHMEIRSML